DRTPGAIMAVELSSSEVEPLLAGFTNGEVQLICISSPSSVTASGDEPAILILGESLKYHNIFHRKLSVNAAHHSKHMTLMSDDLSKRTLKVAQK
ncbi:hypothetical protein K432DRAFT_266517, partial [Lepidopterella palustris CBS 459.81]